MQRATVCSIVPTGHYTSLPTYGITSQLTRLNTEDVSAQALNAPIIANCLHAKVGRKQIESVLRASVIGCLLVIALLRYGETE